MNPVTKHLFLDALQCRTRGWYLRHLEHHEPITEAVRFRMEQGQEVGSLAQQLYTSGVLIPPGTRKETASTTADLLNDLQHDVFFEATFITDHFVAKVDILQRLEPSLGWKLIEVKSSFSDSKKVKQYTDDIAYTATVLLEAGIQVAEAALPFLSREYRKGMDVQHLFDEVDVTSNTLKRSKELRKELTDVHDATSAPTRPRPQLVQRCKSCEFFQTECLGKDASNPVTTLPNLNKKTRQEFINLGIIDISDIPEDMALSSLQQRVVSCVKNQTNYVGTGLSERLAEVEWPAHYLDFETVATTLPLYENHPPHDQVLTQFSIHTCDKLGQVTSHVDFLADPRRDCQRELAEKLIESLDGSGSIIVYSSFEKTQLCALAKTYPDLQQVLDALIERLYDLMAVIKNDYYHPDFGGSISIKSTLPALVPELSYDDLEIGDGDAAIANFARMALEQHADPKVCQALLDYCRLDTLAMVKLHHELHQQANS